MNGSLKQLGLALIGLSAITLMGEVLRIGGLSALPASAQTTPNQAMPGLGSSDQNNDAMSGADGLNMYDLMHQLQRGALPSMSEFNQEQQRTINSAASDFRTRQLERLRQQNQQAPTPQNAQIAPFPSSQPATNSLPQ